MEKNYYLFLITRVVLTIN